MANEGKGIPAAWSRLLAAWIALPVSLTATEAPFGQAGWEPHSRLPEGRAAMIPLPGEEIRLMGGNFWNHDEKIFASDGFRWNEQRETWEHLDSCFQTPPHAAHASSGDLLYLYGGVPPVWTTFEADKDSTVERGAPSPRTYAVSTVHMGNLWVIGGEQPDRMGTACQTLVLDTDSGRMQRSLPSPTDGSLINAFALTGAQSIQVLGGGRRTDAGIVNSDAVYAWDESKAAWKITGRMPEALRGHIGVRLNPEAWFIGGGYLSDSKSFSRKAWIYYPERRHWQRLPDLPEGIMQGSVFIRGGSIHIAGGEIAPKTRSDQVLILPARVVDRYLASSN